MCYYYRKLVIVVNIIPNNLYLDSFLRLFPIGGIQHKSIVPENEFITPNFVIHQHNVHATVRYYGIIMNL